MSGINLAYRHRDASSGDPDASRIAGLVWYRIWYHSGKAEISLKSKLLERAMEHPTALRYEELCSLAEQLGFVHVRTRGSHAIYMHEDMSRPLSFQQVGGMAKPFQVRQLLAAARELGILGEE
jgi:hypothetical protein